MSIRVRSDGTMLCAAKHAEKFSDLRYIDDGLHYILAVEQRVLIPDEDEPTTGRWHWRRMGEPFRGLPGDDYDEDPMTAFGSEEPYG